MRQDNQAIAEEMGGFAMNSMVHGRETSSWVWGFFARYFAGKVELERATWIRIQAAIRDLPWCEVCQYRHEVEPTPCFNPSEDPLEHPPFGALK